MTLKNKIPYFMRVGLGGDFPLAVGARSPEQLQTFIIILIDLMSIKQLVFFTSILCIDANKLLTCLI